MILQNETCKPLIVSVNVSGWPQSSCEHYVNSSYACLQPKTISAKYAILAQLLARTIKASRQYFLTH
jgi:hypothetical protein